MINVVEDANADPSGSESILPVLNEHVADDTALYFPPGRYLVDEPWTHTTFSNIGFVGDRATFTVPDGYARHMFDIGLPGHGDTGFLFRGFTFDFTAPKSLPRPFQVLVDDGIDIRDVLVKGKGSTARVDVTSAKGTGLVERLRRPDGGEQRDHENPVGFLVGNTSLGTLRIEDCHLARFPNNGLYASGAKGPVHVIGGTYENSAIANVRVGDGSVVRGVTVRCNAAPAGFENMRGIRLRNGASALVENCTVEMSEVTGSGGAIVVEQWMETATIRNTAVRISVDGVPALFAKSPTAGIQRSKPTAITCDSVTISGNAGTGSTVLVVDRDGCQFSDVSLSQSGPNRDGFQFIRSKDAVLRDTSIDVTGEPILTRASNVKRVSTSTDTTATTS